MQKKVSHTTVSQSRGNFLFSLLDQIKWGESYTSLLLGIFVVIIASILIFSFTRHSALNSIGSKTDTSSEQTASLETSKSANEITHTVVEGDTLWGIAEMHYQSGFKWGEIAKANNIAVPGNLEVGTKLKISTKETQILATNTSKAAEEASKTQTTSVIKPDIAAPITKDTYIIQRGDDLWDIAVRAYGDGYKWPAIATANNLTDPNTIHADNSLKIPR